MASCSGVIFSSSSRALGTEEQYSSQNNNKFRTHGREWVNVPCCNSWPIPASLWLFLGLFYSENHSLAESVLPSNWFCAGLRASADEKNREQHSSIQWKSLQDWIMHVLCTNLLFQFILSVVDSNGIIVSVQPMDKCLKIKSSTPSETPTRTEETFDKATAHMQPSKLQTLSLLTWIEGLLRCPKFEVVCRGSWARTIVFGLIRRKASITTCQKTTLRDNMPAMCCEPG